MAKWKAFEHLVEQIHKIFDGDAYTVEHDVDVEESNGAKHQIDVVLTPKSPFARPILVSCKSGKGHVEKEHIREWADIVANTGAAAGVIVSPSGFTSGAIDLASEPRRRLTLWIPRPLTDADFEPDEKSPTGYIKGTNITGHIKVPVPRRGSFRLDCRRVDGVVEGREIPIVLSAEHRDGWFLRDERDNIVGNLWDLYLAEAEKVTETSEIGIVPDAPRFIVVEGVRLLFKSMHLWIDVHEIEHKITIDLTNEAFAYENAVTGEVRFVPLPRSVLESPDLRST